MNALPVLDVAMIGGTLGLGLLGVAFSIVLKVRRLRRRLRWLDPSGRW